jgi:hypothetical protein
MTRIKISKYTTAIQKLIGSKTKVEPWLHIAFIGDIYKQRSELNWTIFIWDNPIEIEAGSCELSYSDLGREVHQPIDKLGQNKLIASFINQMDTKAKQQLESLSSDSIQIFHGILPAGSLNGKTGNTNHFNIFDNNLSGVLYVFDNGFVVSSTGFVSLKNKTVRMYHDQTNKQLYFGNVVDIIPIVSNRLPNARKFNVFK